MSKIMITGDRQNAVIYPGQVAIEMMRALAAGDTIVTGVNDGVEAMVRGLGEAVGITIDTIPNPETMLPNGKPDWDERSARIEENGVDSVVAVHVDPQSSSVIASLLRTLPDESLRLVTPVDLLV